MAQERKNLICRVADIDKCWKKGIVVAVSNQVIKVDSWQGNTLSITPLLRFLIFVVLNVIN
jgi:hypothetical protein